tara:strand:+ start:459 stop:818 length:360 start_codon:yes stop_codon:yes gene_type:complete
MRRTASEVIRSLETRIARLERQALQVRHKNRQRSQQLTSKIRIQIAKEMRCSLADCHTHILNEGFDRELGIRYYLVKAVDTTSLKEMFFVVGDEGGGQGLEDWGTDARSVKRTFNQLLG